MKEQILRKLIRESIKKMISESKTLKEYSGDSGLEELIEALGYSDVMDFFEDNSGAVEAVIAWAESIPQLKQKMKQAGMTEATLKEAEQTVKSEAASRLADFFRIPVHTLDKFNFDGNDNIKAVSNALNSTSMQGAQMYYDMAIKLAKEDLGVEESINEADMTRQYDGFIILDQKTKKNYKFNYIKGVDNVKAENDAIAKLMQKTSSPRGNFIVNGLIKKGEFDKASAEVSEQQIDTNAIRTKIKEAGGRRFAKTESVRQHNISKIKEANKKK